MANADAAFGMRPVRYASGRAYTGAGQPAYASDTSTALAIGDPLTLTGTAESTRGLPVFKRAAAGAAIDGVLVGYLSDKNDTVLTRDNARVIAADTSGVGAFVIVETDPDVIYEIQEDSGGENVQYAEVGLHADIIVTAPDSVNGISKVELDSNTAAADSTGGLALKIIGLSQRQGNAQGANAVWDVMINDTAYRSFGSSR